MLEELKKALEQREESLEKAKYTKRERKNNKWVYTYSKPGTGTKGSKEEKKVDKTKEKTSNKFSSLEEAEKYFHNFAKKESYADWIQVIGDDDEADEVFSGNKKKLMLSLFVTGNRELDLDPMDEDEIMELDNMSNSDKIKLKNAVNMMKESHRFSKPTGPGIRKQEKYQARKDY